MFEKARTSDLEASIQERVESAIALMNHAIDSNLGVSDELLETLSAVTDSKEGSPHERSNRVDMLLRDLTAITYPTTVETLRASGAIGNRRSKGTIFLWWLVPVGLAALALAIMAHGKSGTVDPPEKWLSIRAAGLGFLGSLVYIFYNLIGVLRSKAFREDDVFNHSVRLVLGAMLGWVFYFALAKSDGANQAVILLVPFIAGYSTRFVVGILDQAIKAAELTLGLEDGSADLLRRRKKQREKDK